jgi:Putative multicopper oxidases
MIFSIFSDNYVISANFGTTESHAFHLHGHTFNVIATGNLPNSLMNANDIVQLINIKKIPVSAAPAFKDTLAIPSRGYAVIRFVANNPGINMLNIYR